MATIEFAERFIGAGSKLTFTVKDEDGVLADPDTLTVTVYQPDRSVLEIYEYGTDVELERVSEGVFTLIVRDDEVGVYTIHAEAENPIAAGIFKIKVRGL